MSTSTNGAAAPKKSAAPEKKQVKILMIHGFTQNGPLFRAKTRALEKALTKLLAPVSLVPQLLYPTGPIRLKASDMPFYEPPADGDPDYEPETYAWWRRNDATGQYAGIDRGMATLAGTIREAGGVDGVIGFSQGGCAAGVVAGDDTEAWATALRSANGGRPLKFAVVYSGFRAADPDVAWLFAPKIATPTLHVLGSLDTSVDEARSQTLIQVCEDPLVVTHPGGHHVPVAREWVMPLAGFIKQHVYDKEVKSEL
ncbi:dihydrofolate reductase [Akanthomyces lecanii RCEF 1005]|uniref:Dihydrofolate reductase n=1 Tax=Akanthomyces lecanii RCEF 1005 TaxID=1081108 RepID=A0A168GTC2_CORDF|nr:dihydrofolate reductase [Akanthomyces lecanii RCEF 1005]